ncbi:MAG: outer membrane beta-barrel protein [Betaproteobacteria bacterium]|nr:outer membrane beta-barrel protein [Betaproteobacteria bacterium]MDH5579496.1 outer membrane beta-barrel protein [Betaproteobacteria bacterium]
MKSIAWLTGAALMLAGQYALAQNQERFYLGASAGASDIDDKMTTGLITSGPVDGSDSGTKLFGGYRFGRNLALELAYVDLGKLSYSGDFSGTPVTGGKVKVSGLNTSLVATHQATPKLGLFAKAGLYAWDAKASDVTGGVPFSAKDDGADLSFGVGADYFFTKNVGARVEWEHFELDPGKASLLSAGLVVKF